MPKDENIPPQKLTGIAKAKHWRAQIDNIPTPNALKQMADGMIEELEALAKKKK